METLESNRLEQVGIKVFCHVQFEGYTSKWLGDTGSTYSVMNVEIAFELGLTDLIRPEGVEMISYTGEKMEIIESKSGEPSLRNNSHRTKIIVTKVWEQLWNKNKRTEDINRYCIDRHFFGHTKELCNICGKTLVYVNVIRNSEVSSRTEIYTENESRIFIKFYIIE